MKLRSKTDSDECPDLWLGTIVSNRRTEIERQFLCYLDRIDQRTRKDRALGSRVVSRKAEDRQILLRAENVCQLPDFVRSHRRPFSALIRCERERILGEGPKSQRECESEGKNEFLHRLVSVVKLVNRANDGSEDMILHALICGQVAVRHKARVSLGFGILDRTVHPTICNLDLRPVLM